MNVISKNLIWKSQNVGPKKGQEILFLISNSEESDFDENI